MRLKIELLDKNDCQPIITRLKEQGIDCYGGNSYVFIICEDVKITKNCAKFINNGKEYPVIADFIENISIEWRNNELR